MSYTYIYARMFSADYIERRLGLRPGAITVSGGYDEMRVTSAAELTPEQVRILSSLMVVYQHTAQPPAP